MTDLRMTRDEAIKTSPFVVGAEVALVSVNFDRRIERRVVGKVHRNGRFFLGAGDGIGTAMWTPDRNGRTASRSGEQRGYIHREHIELWTEEHDREVAEQAEHATRRRRVARLEEVLRTHRLGNGNYDPAIDPILNAAASLTPEDKRE